MTFYAFVLTLKCCKEQSSKKTACFLGLQIAPLLIFCNAAKFFAKKQHRQLWVKDSSKKAFGIGMNGYNAVLACQFAGTETKEQKIFGKNF